MLVSRYGVTFSPMILGCQPILCEMGDKVTVTKYIQYIGHQHVLISNNTQYKQNIAFSVEYKYKL